MSSGSSCAGSVTASGPARPLPCQASRSIASAPVVAGAQHELPVGEAQPEAVAEHRALAAPSRASAARCRRAPARASPAKASGVPSPASSRLPCSSAAAGQRSALAVTLARPPSAVRRPAASPARSGGEVDPDRGRAGREPQRAVELEGRAVARERAAQPQRPSGLAQLDPPGRRQRRLQRRQRRRQLRHPQHRRPASRASSRPSASSKLDLAAAVDAGGEARQREALGRHREPPLGRHVAQRRWPGRAGRCPSRLEVGPQPAGIVDQLAARHLEPELRVGPAGSSSPASGARSLPQGVASSTSAARSTIFSGQGRAGKLRPRHASPGWARPASSIRPSTRRPRTSRPSISTLASRPRSRSPRR